MRPEEREGRTCCYLNRSSPAPSAAAAAKKMVSSATLDTTETTRRCIRAPPVFGKTNETKGRAATRNTRAAAEPTPCGSTSLAIHPEDRRRGRIDCCDYCSDRGCWGECEIV